LSVVYTHHDGTILLSNDDNVQPVTIETQSTPNSDENIKLLELVDITKSDLNKEQLDIGKGLILQYKDIFSKGDHDKSTHILMVPFFFLTMTIAEANGEWDGLITALSNSCLRWDLTNRLRTQTKISSYLS
jgi:hypothetical protein